MNYDTFIKIAKEAHQSRCEDSVMALCEAYASMDCSGWGASSSIYTVDVQLILEVFGGPPAGWQWTEYHEGLGGYTNLRRLPVWEMPDHSQTVDSIDEMLSEIETTSLTDAAEATLSFFGWVVLEEREFTVVVGNDIGRWLTTYADLNGAALSRDERDEISSEEMSNAHDDWGERWGSIFYTIYALQTGEE